jgi:hypothetical protein
MAAGDEGILELDVVLGGAADADAVLDEGKLPRLSTLLDDQFGQEDP